MKGPLCFALLLLMADASSAGEPLQIKDQELSLGGVALGDTETSVLRKLGRPTRRTDTGDFLDIRLDYPGLTVWLGEGRRVGEVLSTSKRHCTPSDICPGMSFARAKARYGTPLVSPRQGDAFIEYPSSESSCWLQLATRKGTIKSLRAECQP